jgi:hypothetical protein
MGNNVVSICQEPPCNGSINRLDDSILSRETRGAPLGRPQQFPHYPYISKAYPMPGQCINTEILNELKKGPEFLPDIYRITKL